jgi:hypothetical protein
LIKESAFQFVINNHDSSFHRLSREENSSNSLEITKEPKSTDHDELPVGGYLPLHSLWAKLYTYSLVGSTTGKLRRNLQIPFALFRHSFTIMKSKSVSFHHLLLLTMLLLMTPLTMISSFTIGMPAKSTRRIQNPQSRLSAKSKKRTVSGGGGFGGSKAKACSSSSSTPTISADKKSLEKQWDTFASITDLEIAPKGDPDGKDYIDFEVADIFVKCDATENNQGTSWFRIGKVCTLEETPMNASLILQKGLIFWTAVHMRRELVAAGGKSGAASLQLGFAPATLNMGSESDGPIDVDDQKMITTAIKNPSISKKEIKSKSFGFRPDWNPPGFTYKRRENEAMKKKISKLDEMRAATSPNE